MITTHRLRLPLSETDVRGLRAGDQVILDGEMTITAGLPTHQRIQEHLDRGEALPVDLQGGALFHLGSYSQDGPAGFEVLYMNPTTSTRFNGYMPGFIRNPGLHRSPVQPGITVPLPDDGFGDGDHGCFRRAATALAPRGIRASTAPPVPLR